MKQLMSAATIVMFAFMLLAVGCGSAGNSGRDAGDITAAVRSKVEGNGPGGTVKGNIFTSRNDGSTVNGNIYDMKAEVYLTGGPPPSAPCTSAGLPDGTYYFMVTDPAGRSLLSTDGIQDRQFTVSGGVIVSAASHATGPGKCEGAISVQLMPFADTANSGGEYKVWATPQADYDPSDRTTAFGFRASGSKTDNFKVRKKVNGIYGMKYYDTNVNGVFDDGDVPIADWKTALTPGPTETFTGVDGRYFFPVDPGLYTVSEMFPLSSAWRSVTGITSGNVEVISGLVQGPDFGNVCLGPGGGLALGFWSNKNGLAKIGADDLALLTGLHLQDGLGKNFDPADLNQFRSWILGANSVNMAYMLSAQLAAMALNVHNYDGVFGVNENSLIYAPGTESATVFGFATVDAILAEADLELGLHGLSIEGSPFRAYQETLKNALDNASNNMTFLVSPLNPDFSALCPKDY